jgi:hypothetical protein
MTTQPPEADFSDRFTTDELATLGRQPFRLSVGRSMTALELLTAWSLHVHRIDRERSESGEDPRTWDANDFVAALLLRDFLEDCMVSLPGPLRSKVAELADGVDELFTSITQVDDRHLIDQVTDREQAGRQWWWQRIPDSGPILTHLLE